MYDIDYHGKKSEDIVNRYLQDVMKIASDIVVKQQTLAVKNETMESTKEFGEYRLAFEKIDTYDAYIYEYDDFKDIGLSDLEANTYANDNSLIPDIHKEALLEARRKFIIDNYEEKNNYYRMLMGLPNNDDTDKILLINEININDYPKIQSIIDLTKNIIEYNPVEISLLEDVGIIQLLKKRYPNKRYLNHLGIKSIKPYNARMANGMSILYTPNDANDVILVKFKTFFQNNVAYSKRVLSHQALTRYEHYEAIMIIMAILFAVRETIVGYLQLILNRDFFDDDIIRNVFLSFGVDTFDDLPKYIRIQLAKNINNLLQNKGTDDVIIDICKIFGFNSQDVFKFYLFKEHRVDSNGNFLYQEKEIPDPDSPGNTKKVPDLDAMYDLYFVKTPITASDPIPYAADSLNVYQYHLITNSDKYWGTGEDKSELRRKIMEKEFNYIETKYISINNIYSIVDLLFEINYFFRAVRDNKDLLNSIKLSFNQVNSGKISLFQGVTALFALTSARLGFAGNIFQKPTTALYYLGFNYEADIDALKELLKDTPYYNLLDDFQKMTPDMSSAQLLNNFFTNKKVYTKLRLLIRDVRNWEHFKILKKVEKAILFVRDITESYDNKPTFLDYLKDTDLELYKILKDVIDKDATLPYDSEDKPIENMIREILTSLEETLHDDRFSFLFMGIPNITSEFLKAYLYKVIDFFKSYTIELDKMSLYYVIVGEEKPEIRVLDDLHQEKLIEDLTTISGSYNDDILMEKTILIEDKITSSFTSKVYEGRRVEISEY